MQAAMAGLELRQSGGWLCATRALAPASTRFSTAGESTRKRTCTTVSWLVPTARQNSTKRTPTLAPAAFGQREEGGSGNDGTGSTSTASSAGASAKLQRFEEALQRLGGTSTFQQVESLLTSPAYGTLLAEAPAAPYILLQAVAIRERGDSDRLSELLQEAQRLQLQQAQPQQGFGFPPPADRLTQVVKDVERIAAEMNAQANILEWLQPRLEQVMGQLALEPCVMQLAALAQLEVYNEPLWRVAAERYRTAGVLQQDLQAVEGPKRGLLLVAMANAYASVGHYDEQLTAALAEQLLEHFDGIADDVAALEGLTSAYLELQHLEPRLLQAIGVCAARLVDQLGPKEVSTVLLAFTFFSARNQPFYELMLQRAAAIPPEEYGLREAGTLYRACVLLPDPLPLPPQLREVFKYALDIAESMAPAASLLGQSSSQQPSSSQPSPQSSSSAGVSSSRQQGQEQQQQQQRPTSSVYYPSARSYTGTPASRQLCVAPRRAPSALQIAEGEALPPDVVEALREVGLMASLEVQAAVAQDLLQAQQQQGRQKQQQGAVVVDPEVVSPAQMAGEAPSSTTATSTSISTGNIDVEGSMTAVIVGGPEACAFLGVDAAVLLPSSGQRLAIKVVPPEAYCRNVVGGRLKGSAQAEFACLERSWGWAAVRDIPLEVWQDAAAAMVPEATAPVPEQADGNSTTTTTTTSAAGGGNTLNAAQGLAAAAALARSGAADQQVDDHGASTGGEGVVVSWLRVRVSEAQRVLVREALQGFV